jgi:DNA-binding response OmpR family regulator
MEQATKRSYDLLLLDLVLPGPSGLDILKAVRQLRPSQPVIILTARGDEHDRVEGLRLGADDYVVKPFSVKELLARVEAVLRRSPERPREVRYATCSADKARRLLDYRTTVSLRDGLQSIIDWISAHGTKPFEYHLPIEIDSPLVPATWTSRLL